MNPLSTAIEIKLDLSKELSQYNELIRYATHLYIFNLCKYLSLTEVTQLRKQIAGLHFSIKKPVSVRYSKKPNN